MWITVLSTHLIIMVGLPIGNSETDCRKDESMVEHGRRCKQICTNDTQCKLESTLCLCDDWCGRSCFDPNQRCEYLKPPRNGYIMNQGGRYGDIAVYGCHTGYMLSGSQNRKCRSDGKWTETAPTCLPFLSCGKRKIESNVITLKIVRGQETPRGAWPWQAMLVYNSGRAIYRSLHALLGGATVINNHWVMSSAHLFDNFPSDDPSSWLVRIFVVAGISRIPDSGDPLPSEMQVYQPAEILRHEKYNKVGYDYDISLIRIGSRMLPDKKGYLAASDHASASSFSFSRHLQSVCLPCFNGRRLPHGEQSTPNDSFSEEEICETRNSTSSEKPLYVTGFGAVTPMKATDLFLKRSNVLRQGVIYMLPRAECLEGIRRIHKFWKNAIFTSRMFCARGNESSNLSDACVGDSGGPLLQMVTSSAGESYWIQIGVVSWGWGCANTDNDGFTYPGYYTDVTSVLEWISDTLKGKKTIGIIDQSNASSNTQESNNSVEATILFANGGMNHKFNFPRNATVNFIKGLIEKFFGYPVSKQMLFYKSRRLSGTRTLSYYGFEPGGYLFVFISSQRT